ncbi:MAG: LacI family DNA-binding transcriptional regulator [Gammaproteobacteria bacterium]
MIRASNLVSLSPSGATAVTISDVAKRVGVSIKTVSRVVNRAPNVRPETRDRVQQAIDDMNYRPNPVAVSLGRMRRRDPLPLTTA